MRTDALHLLLLDLSLNDHPCPCGACADMRYFPPCSQTVDELVQPQSEPEPPASGTTPPLQQPVTGSAAGPRRLLHRIQSGISSAAAKPAAPDPGAEAQQAAAPFFQPIVDNIGDAPAAIRALEDAGAVQPHRTAPYRTTPHRTM